MIATPVIRPDERGGYAENVTNRQTTGPVIEKLDARHDLDRNSSPTPLNAGVPHKREIRLLSAAPLTALRDDLVKPKKYLGFRTKQTMVELPRSQLARDVEAIG